MTESWHADISPELDAMRAMGFTVIDRPRPRDDPDVASRGGGVAVCAIPHDDLTLTHVPLNIEMVATEMVAAGMRAGRNIAIFAVVYRPGSQHITQQFFDGMEALFNVTLSVHCPVYIVGDFNVHFERSEDTDTKKMIEIMKNSGYRLCNSGPTRGAESKINAVSPWGETSATGRSTRI